MDASRFTSNSNWLRAPDLQGTEHTLTVNNVTEADFDGKAQLVLAFNGAKKQLGLNVTNTKMMIEIYGAETNGWVGQRVELYVVPTERGPGIRVRAPAPAGTVQAPVGPTPQALPAAPAAAPAGPNPTPVPVSEDIPF